MQINADFENRASAHASAMDWAASPARGVERKMLDRIGGEVARATTIVRFAPESAFDAHIHHGGEEFIVLEGVFQDEHGDFPAGSYVRNPPTSKHTPASAPGCVIMVKLWQFDPMDRTHVRIATENMERLEEAGRAGVSVSPLFRDARETVRMERWAPGAEVALGHDGGAEYFTLKGGFEESGEEFGPWSWLRLPEGGRGVARAGEEGAEVWVKTGHLPYAKPPG